MMRRMRISTPRSGRPPSSERRRGSSTVEFAVMVPLFVTLTMGMIETGIQITAAHTLTESLRQAGRLATMNYSNILLPGQTINQKIITDVQNFLTAEGINGSQVTVTITAVGGSAAGSSFNLSSSSNINQLFQISASIPSSAISKVTFFPTSNTISASIVFQLGDEMLVQ